MADDKDKFIVQVTVQFDGQTDPEHVMNRVWEQLEKTASEGFTFPAISAWRFAGASTGVVHAGESDF